MQIHRGYLRIELPNVIPIWIHWSVLILGVFVGGLAFRPGAWLAAFLIILIHEFGHAVAVAWARATATDIFMDATGGRCEWFGEVTRAGRLGIASGGVIAQLLLWVVAFLILITTGPPRTFFLADFLHVLLWWNLILVALNLLPVSPLDGHTIWPLLPNVLREWQRRQRARRRQRLTAVTLKHIEKLDRLEPKITPRREAREAIRQAIEQAAKANKQDTEKKDD